MSRLQRLTSLPAKGLLLLVRLYRVLLSPLKPACCRFTPTCSAYALEAIRVHGAIRGSLLTLWRIMRCHPFYHGDLYDPVPPAKGGAINRERDNGK